MTERDNMRDLQKAVIIFITLSVFFGFYYHQDTIFANRGSVNLIKIEANGLPDQEETTQIKLTFDGDPGELKEGRVVVEEARIKAIHGEGNERILELKEQNFHDQKNIKVSFLPHQDRININPETVNVKVSQVGSYVTLLGAELYRNVDDPRRGTIFVRYSDEPDGLIHMRTNISSEVGNFVKILDTADPKVLAYEYKDLKYDNEIAHGGSRWLKVTHDVGKKIIQPKDIIIREVDNPPIIMPYIRVNIDHHIAPQEERQGNFGFSFEEGTSLAVRSVAIREGEATLKLNRSLIQDENPKVLFQPTPEQAIFYKAQTLQNSFRYNTTMVTQNDKAIIRLQVNGKLEQKKITNNGGFGINILKEGMIDNSKQAEVTSVETSNNKILLKIDTVGSVSNEEIEITYTPPQESENQIIFSPKVQQSDIFTTSSNDPLSQDQKGIFLVEEIENEPMNNEESVGIASIEDEKQNRQFLSDRSEQSDRVEKNPVRPDDLIIQRRESKPIAKMTVGQKEYVLYRRQKEIKQWMDVPPMIHKGHTMLPVREIANTLGVEVKYEHDTKTANFRVGKQKFHLVPGDPCIWINQQKIPMTSEVLLQNDRMLIPLIDVTKALSELGIEVIIEWDDPEKSIMIRK